MSTAPSSDAGRSASRGAAGAVPPTADARRESIGWPRAILSGLALLALGIGIGVYGAQFAVEQLTGLDRDQRVYVATALMTVAVVGMAWLLRRLQSRGVI